MSNRAIILCFSLLLLACNKKELLFKNPTSQETGLFFENTITPSDDLNILDYLYYYNGGGVALGDINNDGLVDIFLSANQEKNKLTDSYILYIKIQFTVNNQTDTLNLTVNQNNI